MQVVADLDPVDERSHPDLDSGVAAAPRELVLEPAAIELVRVEEGGRGGRVLDARGDVAVVTRWEEETKAELPQLLAVEVVRQVEHVAEVVRAGLGGRLADLECGLR